MKPFDRQFREVIARPLALVALLAAVGCTRAEYRQAADAEVRRIVAGANQDPRWELARFPIATDSRSRYHDAEAIDCPPMPEDDPVSHRYMHCVDCMAGYPCWHIHGARRSLDNPAWRPLLGDYIETTGSGAVRLTLDDSVKLALIHSPGYRSQLESLYLSGLDVSTERFRFDVQFFGTNTTEYEHLGRERGPGGETNTLTTENNFLLRKRFATGAELLVGLVNSFVWQFAGTDSNSALSILNFNLMQPLLRAGGRDVVLEQLTIVERTLLANLRSFERYRHGFYTNVAIGDGGLEGVQRRGGFFGGTGLTGFTGQGSGGFGEVGGATGFGRGGFGGGGGGGGGGSGAGFAGGGAGTVGGFIGLLQQLQQVRNTQDSLDAQVRTLGLLEANLQAGLIDIAQVDQFRQNIETERANLLQARNGLANSQDNFLVNTLGLPPDLPVELDDSLIAQFRFIDPQTTATQNQLEDFVELLGDLPQAPAGDELSQAVAVLRELRAKVALRIDEVRADLDRLHAAAPSRRRDMNAAEARSFATDLVKLAEALADLETRYRESAAGLEAWTVDDPARALDRLVSLAVGLAGLTQELALVQARARVESVTLDRIALTPEHALALARIHRLDWMNNRAALVDTWRLIAFNANALESSLDVTFAGDLLTQGDNPVKFQSPTGSLRVGVRFDAPFTRLLERNNYRQVLIDYQRDRRRLIQYEDGVNLSLRRLLRQLEQLGQNLEIQRRAVVIAVRRVDQTREVLNQPPQVAAAGEASAALGPTAAQNLLTALSDVRNTQNNFMSVWLNYYATRMTLVRDLGLMQLDENGLWIDRPLDDSLRLDDDDCELPPAIPVAWLAAAGVEADEPEVDAAVFESEPEDREVPAVYVEPEPVLEPAAAAVPRRGVTQRTAWTGRSPYVATRPQGSPASPRRPRPGGSAPLAR